MAEAAAALLTNGCFLVAVSFYGEIISLLKSISNPSASPFVQREKATLKA